MLHYRSLTYSLLIDQPEPPTHMSHVSSYPRDHSCSALNSNPPNNSVFECGRNELPKRMSSLSLSSTVGQELNAGVELNRSSCLLYHCIAITIQQQPTIVWGGKKRVRVLAMNGGFPVRSSSIVQCTGKLSSPSFFELQNYLVLRLNSNQTIINHYVAHCWPPQCVCSWSWITSHPCMRIGC